MVKKCVSSLVISTILGASVFAPYNAVSAHNSEPIQVESKIDNADKVQPHSPVAIYFIPGIGQVALLATGAVAVGGVTYYAGSWIYEKVMDFLGKKDKK